MATVRLRKAFRYPEDSDDGAGREELDEQEQEEVIRQLQQEIEKRNSQYAMAFSIIPLPVALVFIPKLFMGSVTAVEWLLCLLSTLSLFATSFAMSQVPLRRPDRKGKAPMLNPPGTISRLQDYATPANASICTFLALVYCFSGRSFNVQPGLYLVPGTMLVATLIARRVMLSVDIKQLQDLRYEYRGA